MSPHPLVEVVRVGPAGDTASIEVNYPAPAPKSVVVYCDGSCLGNPGPGGWAALIRIEGEKEQFLSGSDAYTTSNRMELMAAIQALHAVPIGSEVKIHSDSMYLVKGMTEWQFKWANQNWKTSNGRLVANADLWRGLVALASQVVASWKWIEGHAGIKENELVDKIARKAARKEQYGE